MNLNIPTLLCLLVLCTPVSAADALSEARTLYLSLLLSEPDEAVEAIIEPPTTVTPEGANIQFSRTAESVLSGETEQRWLVSEPWCANCPAAKAKFLASGGQLSHIITIKESRSRHNKIVNSVPYEYSQKTYSGGINPAVYRSVSKMSIALDGNTHPSHATILSHLRNAGPHKSKRWQAWYLDNWKVQQLYALHDDDHQDNVSYEDPAPALMVADVAQPPSTAVVLYSLSELFKESTSDTGTLMSSWFEYDLDAPDILPAIVLAIMKDKVYTNDKIGVTLTWPGQQTFSIRDQSITLSPPIQVSASKYGVKARASISEIKFNDDFTSVTVITPEVLVPDITVNFK